MTETRPAAVKETVARLLAAYGASDIPKVLSLLHEDVIWKSYGDPEVPWTGRGVHHGHAQVEQYLQSMFTLLIPVSFNITLQMVEGDHMALFGNYSYLVKANDNLMPSDWAMVIKVVGDKVMYFSIYEDTFAIARAVLGK